MKANQGEAGPGWTDRAIATALEVHHTTVARVRQQDAAGGLDAAVDRKAPERQYRRKLDGQQEAHLVALACSAPPEGRRRWTLRLLADRLELHYTPKHGSWLNMAEIELAVLAGQCLDRRLADQATLQREVGAWQAARNASGRGVDWRFTTADARIKLRYLYPAIHS